MLGNVLVGQSGGPTAVINSSLAGVYKTAKDQGVEKVYGMLYGIQGLLEEKLTDLDEQFASELDLELLKRTPSSFLGSCRYKLKPISEAKDEYDLIFSILDKYDIKYFFYIGGNDSMDTISKLSEYGTSMGSPIRFIGVPKTIDNDLEVTDHTPGYGSAAKYIATAVKELVRDGLVYDTKSVTIVEIMGRNAGWLAGAAALAGKQSEAGPDLIYLPETVFDLEEFRSRVEEIQQTKKSMVVAISEGIRLADGRYVCDLMNSDRVQDMFGHSILSGAANYLATYLKQTVGCKTRAVELNTLQRCSSHAASLVDITEAFGVGGKAVNAALNGETGMMVILKRLSTNPYLCTTETYDVTKIANFEKKVPTEWITDENYVSEEFLQYVRPLIQEELTPIYIDGVPSHIVRK